jgi:hypothetical protein
MSWALFKANILRYANDPDSLQDIDSVARLWAKEYDAAIKRGYDTINFVTIKRGNVEIMEELIKAALLKGQTSREPYDLVGAMGNAVKAYWAGAILNEVPIPLVPAPGATANISVVSNVVINPGTWTPPTSKPSVGISPNLNGTAIETAQDPTMSEEELAGAKEDLAAAEADLEEYSAAGLEEEAITAEEQIKYQQERIDSEENTSMFVEDANLTEEQNEQIEELKNDDESEPVSDDNIGKKIVAMALKDLNVKEDPLPPKTPENSGKRVLEMLANTGIKGPAYWCAAAVTTWYKAAGADYPKSGAASCDVWMEWAKKNKLFSKTPAIGAAILYGKPSDAHHIGIVETIVGSKITTIEGNTSGGGFNRNGVGVFRKTPNAANAVGFVLPKKKQ